MVLTAVLPWAPPSPPFVVESPPSLDDIRSPSGLLPEHAKEPIPVDDHHLHFGGGQTETTLTLPPGRHTLQLVLGDWSHVPFNPPIVSPVITIDVK